MSTKQTTRGFMDGIGLEGLLADDKYKPIWPVLRIIMGNHIFLYS